MAIELDVAAMGMGNGSGLPSNVRRQTTSVRVRRHHHSPVIVSEKERCASIQAQLVPHKQRISWFPLSLPTNIYYIFILAISISMDGETR